MLEKSNIQTRGRKGKIRMKESGGRMIKVAQAERVARALRPAVTAMRLRQSAAAFAITPRPDFSLVSLMQPRLS